MSLTYDDFVSHLAEGFHTALRKAGDSAQADTAWRAIRDMSDDEWGGIVRFVAEPTWEALHQGAD